MDGDPLTLARLYIDTFGLSELYLADLDAIASRPLQAETIRRISARGASLWIDAGVAHPDQMDAVLEAGARMLVVGLETLASFDALADICAHSEQPVAFSLDLRDGVPLNRALAAHPEDIARRAVDAGAQAVIVLDVARVGVAVGPDFDLLRRIRSVVPGAQLFAGGGVRGIDDLRQLAGIGCAGVLVATALHDGRLTADDVKAASGF